MRPWLLAAGFAVGAWLLWRWRTVGTSAISLDSVDTLARVLHVEAGDVGDELEWAGIAYVLANRATARGATWPEVVAWKRGQKDQQGVARAVWTLDLAEFRRRMAGAEQNPRWGSLLDFSRRMVWGLVANPIGDRQSFIHAETQRAMGRPLPDWITNAESPITVGRATFV